MGTAAKKKRAELRLALWTLRRYVVTNHMRLSSFEAKEHSGLVNWLLWVNEDDESHRRDKLFAGRVKFQDDPVALTHAVLQDALEKTESALGGPAQDPLF